MTVSKIASTPSLSSCEKEKLSRNFEKFSKPNLLAIHETISFTKSTRPPTNPISNPLIAPLTAPNMPSVLKPSMAPITVSYRAIAIVNGSATAFSKPNIAGRRRAIALPIDTPVLNPRANPPSISPNAVKNFAIFGNILLKRAPIFSPSSAVPNSGRIISPTARNAPVNLAHALAI